jgi:cyclomaltodextrinase / maltogenic alpha-amylase / neopullulanase
LVSALPGARVAAAHDLIWFDTVGGDAWTFEKTITGATVQGACDAVVIDSPRGSIIATLRGQRYTARVPLRGGDNPVVALCRKAGSSVASSGAQHWMVRLQDVPHARARTRIDGEAIAFDGGATLEAPGIASPIVRYEWRPWKRNPASLALSPDLGLAANTRRVEIAAPVIDGHYFAELRATDALGRTDESAAVFRVSGCHAADVDTQADHPPWVDSAVVYGVALPLLGPDAFAVLSRHLSAIAGLGATVVWLSPVTEAPTGDFGYAVTDPFRLRASFGSDAEFRQLIASAHAHGLRVILDAVTNHLSDRSAYFADTQLRGAVSPYYPWFQRDAKGRPVHYFDWGNLKNLDYDNPEVGVYQTAALSHWLRDYAIDGFRIDAAWALRQRAPELWPQIRRELTRMNPDIWLLAEASALDPYYSRHGFDAAYDWTLMLGQWAWHDVFGAPSALPDLSALRAALAKSQGSQTLILRFLNNNDTGLRFITRHGPEQTRVAAAMVFTLPGIPLIYDGDESGAALEPYTQGAALTWNDAYGLTALYARLAHLRRDTAGLRSPQFALLHTNHDDAVLAYDRGDDNGASHLLVLLNFGAAPLSVRLSPTHTPWPTTGNWTTTDLETGRAVRTAVPRRSIRLPAYGALLLRYPAVSREPTLPPPRACDR